MKRYEYRIKDKNSLWEKITIQDKVMTVYIRGVRGVDHIIQEIVPPSFSTRLIHTKDKDHKGLHVIEADEYFISEGKTFAVINSKRLQDYYRAHRNDPYATNNAQEQGAKHQHVKFDKPVTPDDVRTLVKTFNGGLTTCDAKLNRSKGSSFYIPEAECEAMIAEFTQELDKAKQTGHAEVKEKADKSTTSVKSVSSAKSSDIQQAEDSAPEHSVTDPTFWSTEIPDIRVIGLGQYADDHSPFSLVERHIKNAAKLNRKLVLAEEFSHESTLEGLIQFTKDRISRMAAFRMLRFQLEKLDQSKIKKSDVLEIINTVSFRTMITLGFITEPQQLSPYIEEFFHVLGEPIDGEYDSVDVFKKIDAHYEALNLREYASLLARLRFYCFIQERQISHVNIDATPTEMDVELMAVTGAKKSKCETADDFALVEGFRVQIMRDNLLGIMDNYLSETSEKNGLDILVVNLGYFRSHRLMETLSQVSPTRVPRFSALSFRVIPTGSYVFNGANMGSDRLMFDYRSDRKPERLFEGDSDRIRDYCQKNFSFEIATVQDPRTEEFSSVALDTFLYQGHSALLEYMTSKGRKMSTLCCYTDSTEPAQPENSMQQQQGQEQEETKSVAESSSQQRVSSANTESGSDLLAQQQKVKAYFKEKLGKDTWFEKFKQDISIVEEKIILTKKLPPTLLKEFQEKFPNCDVSEGVIKIPLPLDQVSSPEVTVKGKSSDAQVARTFTPQRDAQVATATATATATASTSSVKPKTKGTKKR